MRFALLLTIVLLNTTALFAQAPTAEITGTITDPSGAPVPGALVTLTNPATNQARTIHTNEAGAYLFPTLPPAVYNLKAESTGFGSQVRNGLELQIGQIARLDFALNLGSVSEVVEVSGGAPVLETETANIGAVIENRRIVELPLNGRNYLQLVSLIPGATTNARPPGVAQLRMGGARSDFTVSVSGQRLAFNRYTLDGIENTDVNFSSYLLLPSIDALQEFKVESGIFQAEFGRGTSQVNVSTRSGSNQLHGVLFEFVRNSAMDAKNFFDSASWEIPAFKRNQFGVTVSGPVIIPKVLNGKDKLFFMVNYEGLRERKGLTQVATVALNPQRTGDFSALPRLIYDPATRTYNAGGQVTAALAFPGNTIPTNRLSPVTTTVFQKYVPVPNAGLTSEAGFYVNSEGRNSDANQLTTRLDFIRNPNDSWFFRYSRNKDTGYVPAILPDQGNNVDVLVEHGVLANTRVFGANKVNDFRFGMVYLAAANIQRRAFVDNVVGQLGIKDIPSANVPLWYGIPVFNVTGFSLIGDCSDCPWNGWNTVFQFLDSFSWTKGKHSLKIGGDFRRVRFNNAVPGRPRGRFGFDGRFTQNPLAANRATTGSAIADFLLEGINNSETLVGAPVSNFRNFHLGLYIQDAWKVSSKLTVNLGLRYENEPPWVDKYDAIVNTDYRWDHSIVPAFVRAGTGDLYEGNPALQSPTTVAQVRDGRFGRHLAKWQRKDFAPRIGIAYSLTPKTVIRSGAGIYFVREISNSDFEVVRNPPFSAQRGEPAQFEVPNLNFQRPFAQPVSVPTFALAVQFNEPTAYVGQWSWGIQRQLTQDTMVEATYLGAAGNHLRRMQIYNQAPPGPGDIQARRPYPQLGTVQTVTGASHSTYHALQMKVQRRFARGLTVLGAFSWGKSIDNGSQIRNTATETLTPSNDYDLRLERGLSGFDFRRRFTASWLYELPFGRGRTFLSGSSRVVDAFLGGWQLGGILTLQDGFPVTVYCGGGLIQNGGGVCYPDATGQPVRLPDEQQTLRRFFNTEAFVDRLAGGAQFRYGNVARNALPSPGILNWDFSLNKMFRLSEKARLEFRTEAFNLPNHPIFGAPGGTLRTANFGVITSTAIDSRQLQLALKLSF
jgi:hypothetical protein